VSPRNHVLYVGPDPPWEGARIGKNRDTLLSPVLREVAMVTNFGTKIAIN